ncbi:MAG: phosphopantothenoylcysteine decarboxylase [Deltaproteobacteria bacterium]|nr:phosphopantothenoylcysteine decarboxylase [Deltaproteobacteria bacterium]
MRILITAGGTREPIDAVRFVGNVGTGATGIALAQEAVRRFHTVQLLSGTGSVEPAQWALDTGLLAVETFTSASDLLDRTVRLLEDYRFDAIVATAAVADYAPVLVDGKIGSTLDELTIRMIPTPKIVDRMRVLAPEARLVSFKLESGVSPSELFCRARTSMARSGADLTVANLLEGHGRPDHSAWLVHGDGDPIAVPTRAKLATCLLDYLEAGQDR